jgi:hypothetical protein
MGSNYLWSDAWLLFGVVIDSAKETRALAVSQADIIAAADSSHTTSCPLNKWKAR